MVFDCQVKAFCHLEEVATFLRIVTLKAFALALKVDFALDYLRIDHFQIVAFPIMKTEIVVLCSMVLVYMVFHPSKAFHYYIGAFEMMAFVALLNFPSKES